MQAINLFLGNRDKTKQIRFATENDIKIISVDFLEQAKEHQKHEIFSVTTENITEEEYVTQTHAKIFFSLCKKTENGRCTKKV